jgi:asparagine synthase (glutamine-hydrolysing)
MCGILGIFRPGGVNIAEAKRSLDMLEHRGPDSAGLWGSADGRLTLGHRRLKILDLSDDSNQPMQSPDGRFVFIYNGEVFNYRDLRSSYRGNWRFRTSGDTEILLALLAERGI